MNHSKMYKIGAAVTLFLLVSMSMLPALSATPTYFVRDSNENKEENNVEQSRKEYLSIPVKTMLFMNAVRLLINGGGLKGIGSLGFNNINTDSKNLDNSDIPEIDLYDPDYIMYDRLNPQPEPTLLAVDQNDINYNSDAGYKASKALVLYIGEPVDLCPGRGRTGHLDPDAGDDEDWYRFSVCAGQELSASILTAENYSCELADTAGDPVGNPYAVEETGRYFLRIYTEDPGGEGEYTIDLTVTGQNDSELGADAGDTIGDASPITPGVYCGYMDSNDWEDWYSFSANSGDGIFATIDAMEKTDFDLFLYNPSDELVHYANWYDEDTLEYPADSSGTWKIKICMFPGWDTSLWPDDYLLYGSGVYDFELTVGGTAEAPIVPEPQPEIIPIAQTFIVNNDPDSNADEYAYLAAVPAANYQEGGDRFVSPIIYEGDSTPTSWSGTIDDTTQYLVDDWNDYLARHGVIATEHTLASDPVEAAADIATEQWSSSDTAVVVVDGSEFEDTVRATINRNVKLNAITEVTTIEPGSEEFTNAGGLAMVPMFIGPKWGAIAVHAIGSGFSGDAGITTPRYEALMDDWWPHDNYNPGTDTDVYHPISIPGFWFPYVSDNDSFSEMVITKVAGDRYKIPIRSTDSSIKVTVTTDDPTALRVYLIDPYGNIRRPSVPHWNGGPINPLHIWNGGHWPGIGEEDWRAWEPEIGTEHTVEVHYPMTGRWKAIVVPASLEYADIKYDYHITVEIRSHNGKRTSAAISAANGAVIASMNHVPLLYVKEDALPSETESALNTLGVDNVIFVHHDNIGSGVTGELGSYTLTELTTMQEIIDEIGENDENYITITSLATGDGYFAPTAMIAAYHNSPILSIGEATEAYNTLDQINTWREYAGDFYHGCRSVGHLPLMSEPFDFKLFLENLKNGIFPHPGFDLKLRWFSAVNADITTLINNYDLNRDGQEAYMFVSPRDTDIRDSVCRAMTGNESYAGQIPVETPAFATAMICREILYPAVIYANPGRDTTTSQMINYPDGGTWSGNDGKSYPNYATRDLKQTFSSRGRFFEGHCIWDNVLERYNAGTSISYYAGHGTGGSGISMQYKNMAEQFPQGTPQHDNLYDFDWWDAWRGYSGYDNRQTKTVREGGSSSYRAEEPNLYDIIHFKYVDEEFDNLHSMMEFWSSCTTGAHFGPMIYLEHGATLWYGNAGSAYGIQTMLHDNWMFNDVLVKGKNFGESHSKYIWIFDRDFTTCDPATLYGRSSLFQGYLSNVHVLFGDPTMICYSPDWVEPVPVSP